MEVNSQESVFQDTSDHEKNVKHGEKAFQELQKFVNFYSKKDTFRRMFYIPSLLRSSSWEVSGC